MEHMIFNLFYYFAIVAILGLFVAALELAYQCFMEPNMFFYPWAVLLHKLARKNQILAHLTRVLGRCRYCNATWVGIYAYLYLGFDLDLKILFVIASVFFFLKILTAWSIFDDIAPNRKVAEIYDKKEVKMPPTPPIPMLWAYLIMGIIYSIIYIVIPYLITLIK